MKSELILSPKIVSKYGLRIFIKIKVSHATINNW